MEPGKYRHDESSHAAAVLHTEQVRSSYAHLPVTLAAVVINASLLFFVLAPVASPAPLQMWFAFSLLLVSLQACIWIAHKRADTAEICPRIWIVLATGGSLASGLLWGSLPWIVSPLDDAHLLFVALVVAGMCAGAATVHAAHFPTAIAYVVPAATP